VDTRSREENAPNQESGVSVLFNQNRNSGAVRCITIDALEKEQP